MGDSPVIHNILLNCAATLMPIERVLHVFHLANACMGLWTSLLRRHSIVRYVLARSNHTSAALQRDIILLSSMDSAAV